MVFRRVGLYVVASVGAVVTLLKAGTVQGRMTTESSCVYHTRPIYNTGGKAGSPLYYVTLDLPTQGWTFEGDVCSKEFATVLNTHVKQASGLYAHFRPPKEKVGVEDGCVFEAHGQDLGIIWCLLVNYRQDLPRLEEWCVLSKCAISDE